MRARLTSAVSSARATVIVSEVMTVLLLSSAVHRWLGPCSPLAPREDSLPPCSPLAPREDSSLPLAEREGYTKEGSLPLAEREGYTSEENLPLAEREGNTGGNRSRT